MTNNRIIVLLKSLDKKEFNRFLQYVESPFFNKSAKLIKLSKYLAKYYPAFPEAQINKKAIYKAVHGASTQIQDQKIHDDLSQLLKLLEGFLIQIQFKTDPIQAELCLLKSLQSRNLEKQFQRVFKRLAVRLEEVETQTPEYFLQRFKVMELEAEFHDARQIRGKHHNMAKILMPLKAFYLGSNLQYICEIINRRGIAKHDTNFNRDLIDEMRQQLEEEGNSYLEIPMISIYYKILLNLLEPEEIEHYEDLKALLAEHIDKFTRSEANVLYSYAQNYCIRQANKGNARFYDELFELYQALLKAELLYNDVGEFPHEHYKNITTLGLMLKRFDWVYEFLGTYKDKLQKGVQENAYSYNLATYYHKTEQHTQAMRLLQQVEFTDVYYNLSARSTVLKIYFEKGEYDSIKYVSQAFLAYLKRNKDISISQLIRFKNFISMIKKMVRVADKKDRIRREEFATEVQRLEQTLGEMKQVSFSAWMRNQIRNMLPQTAPVS